MSVIRDRQRLATRYEIVFVGVREEELKAHNLSELLYKEATMTYIITAGLGIYARLHRDLTT